MLASQRLGMLKTCGVGHQALLECLLPSVATLRRPSLTVSSSASAIPTAHYASAAPAEQASRFFPRRALMYVPACDERKTKKAASLKVDTIVYDIEDGVAVNQKVRFGVVLFLETFSL